MKKQIITSKEVGLPYLLVVIIGIGIFLSVRGTVFAADVNLTVRDGADIVFFGAISLPTEITSVNDAEGAPHTIDANSALAVLASADETSSDFSISNLAYYSSFNSLYLKCLTDARGEKCDNWQYAVNDIYSSVGMDQNILSGGENVYIYFGPQNRVTLSSRSITTDDPLDIAAQQYDYQNNAWIARTGVIIGLTQPDLNNPWSPIEIKISAVDKNGQAVFSSIPAGSYNVGIKEDFYFPTETLTVITSTPIHQSAPAPQSDESRRVVVPAETPTVAEIKITGEAKPVFDLKKAFDFLVAQQKENGSFGEDLYTDWTALAFAPGNYQDQTIKLIKYFGESKPENPILTDYERHSMALMSLGLSPYNVNSENYIEKIIASFDGKQFGDINEDNDDIFALIVLQNAGYAQDEKMISDNISFVLSRQKENGSFDESVDMTGAAIEALSAFNQNEQVKNALLKAKEFLKQNQKENGGWNNASGTAWAIEGILALSEKPENWVKNGNTPIDYLATMQDTDGGIKNENIQNKLWETAYVASILSGKTWNKIMRKFEKPKETLVPQKVEEKLPKQAMKKNNIRESALIVKNSNKKDETPKLENLASQSMSQNTATALTAITDSLAPKTETPKRNWFLRFLDKIFSIF